MVLYRIMPISSSTGGFLSFGRNLLHTFKPPAVVNLRSLSVFCNVYLRKVTLHDALSSKWLMLMRSGSEDREELYGDGGGTAAEASLSKSHRLIVALFYLVVMYRGMFYVAIF